jgi:hypothetical protein
MQKLIPIPIISHTVSSSPPVSVDWKGFEPYGAIGDLNEQYLDDFKEINSVAAVAYINCCSEWLYYFLHHCFKPAEVAIFEQFMIAEWVWLCDLPRKLPPYYDSEALELSLSEPANITAVELLFDSIWDATSSVPTQESFINACFATQVCDYVLPRDCEFTKWRKVILQRLREKFPANKMNPNLIQVSRRIFDTDVNLDDIDNETDCMSLFGDGDFEGNPYLPLTEPESD